MKKIVLIDGHNLLFRMFYGIPSSIYNSKGKEIKGLVGFIGSIKKIIDKFNPDSLVVIFDSETSKNNNLKIDSEYKSNRIDYTNIPNKDNPFSQLPLIKKALNYLEISYIEVDNYEADDYIASITTSISFNQYIIVSTDSDFIQLVNEKVTLYVPRGKRSILYNEEEVYEKYNILPDKYILYKSLIGDKSDNIRGIKGIGKVGATKILKYDTIQKYIINNQNSKYTTLLINNINLLGKNIQLVKMKKDLNISKLVFKEISYKIIDYKTYEIIEKIGEK